MFGKAVVSLSHTLDLCHFFNVNVKCILRINLYMGSDGTRDGGDMTAPPTPPDVCVLHVMVVDVVHEHQNYHS